MHAGFVQLFDELAIGGLGEKFGDCCGYFWSHFGDFFELFLTSSGEILN